MPGEGMGALNDMAGPISDQERFEAGDTGVPASGGKVIDWVPWRSGSTPTHKSVEDWRTQGYSSPSQADRHDAEVRTLQEAAGADPRLATDLEKEAGMFDPATGFGLTDMRTRAEAYEQQVGGNLNIKKDAKEVLGAIFSMTGPELQTITEKMVDAGMLDENFNMAQVQEQWTKLVGHAIDYHAENPTAMLTPVDMIDLMYGDGAPGSLGKGGPSAVDVISKSTTISTNEQARNMLRQMMAANLGRRPTQIEIDEFQGSLNEAQRNNPTVNTRTTQLNANGDATATSDVTTGGMDESEFAYEAVVDTDPDSEYGKYQQATSYYNAFLSAIRGPGGS